MFDGRIQRSDLAAARARSSFRDGPKEQARNLEIGVAKQKKMRRPGARRDPYAAAYRYAPL
jgi:hypothetical protein